ncbi:MAG: DUF4258 domain-containing protein [Candidatus Rokubacteria bacterium]|nr:DUF4258 domain-containing protein [Candidatus Rokubacteria bacterium]
METGEIIEEYPEDRPYPSCLILGPAAGRPLHVVCAPVTAERKLALITVYQPDPDRWDPERRRRRTRCSAPSAGPQTLARPGSPVS